MTRPRADPLAPVVARLLLPLHLRREGLTCLSWLGEVERRLDVPSERLPRVMLERLRRHLEWVRAHVGFYRARFRAAGFDPRRMTSLGDLTRVPPLVRADVAQQTEALLAPRYRGRRLVEARTGGTTSAPVAFVQDPPAADRKDAAAIALRRRLGWGRGTKQAALWGAAQDAPVFVRGPAAATKRGLRRLLVDRLLYLGATDLTDARLDAYAERLRRYRPQALQAYPSAADLLARRLLARGERLAIPLVLLTAEPVFPGQRSRIAAAFGARVATFYGARETGWIAAETARCPRLHWNTANVWLEATQDGRLLVTDLENRAMPLIRYEIGDRGRLDPARCPCGDPRPVLDSVDGRTNDVLVLPSGARVPGVIVEQRNAGLSLGILEAQFVQTDGETLEVRYVPAPRFEAGALDVLRAKVDGLCRGELRLVFRAVDRLEPEPNGKVRYVVSCVARPEA